MSYGSKYAGIKGEVKPTGFGPIPFGWYAAQITAIEEAPNGDLINITLEIHGPAAFKGKFVKFINIYCGDVNKHGDPRKASYVDEMARHVTKLIETQGYADVALQPKLAATHKPLAMFSTFEMFKSRRFLAYIGQEEYETSSGEIRVKNTLDNFQWWDGTFPPGGPDDPQPMLRKLKVDRDAAPRGAVRGNRYEGTGAENDPGPPDYQGGYAGSLPEDKDPPF